MRRVLALLSLFLLFGAASAFAASAPLNQARPLPPVAAVRPAPPPLISLAPAATGVSGLVGLPAPFQPADLGPQCRAECSKVRFRCAPEDTACDTRWTQCLAGCR
jgi:hypothetical protein